MIEIIMSGMCEGCDIAKLELQYTVDKKPDGIHRQYWLGCEYEQVCKKWSRKYGKELQ